MLKVAHLKKEINPEEVRELAMLLVRKQIKRVEDEIQKGPKQKSNQVPRSKAPRIKTFNTIGRCIFSWVRFEDDSNNQ